LKTNFFPDETNEPFYVGETKNLERSEHRHVGAAGRKRTLFLAVGFLANLKALCLSWQLSGSS
jgi:hypothetical protein